MVKLVVIIIFYLISFLLAGELIETTVKNRYFITGRGCGISTKIKYLNYFPEQLDNHDCSFVEANVVSNHPTTITTASTTTTGELDCDSGSEYVGDDYCDDISNTEKCGWDGGDCCGNNLNFDYCDFCECLDPASAINK